MTTIINGEAFVDISEARRKSSDFQWFTAEWDSPKYRFLKPRSPQQLKKEVFNSARVQLTIQELSLENGRSKKQVIELAKQVLDEMAHNYHLSAIRFIGYILAKLMKRLYSHVYVSVDGIEKIRRVCTEHPILLMPTHRSYVDFLLTSYACFEFHLPLPLKAAGLDFLGLKAVAILLRNCGAFFIRRAFGNDKLYWSIFTEYVQSILKHGDAPMEFYVEGTRSRTAKSLTPRLGLLLSAMELFATGQVSDITIVPISITYDRTLEENLYAHELLGVPKPKESTSGLFKARQIIGENYGNICMTVANPISMRDFCSKLIARNTHNLQPRFRSVLSTEEQLVCNDLANAVIKGHQRNMYLSPFPLMCLVLGHDLASGGQGVPYQYLMDQILWLKELTEKTGAYIILQNGESDPWLCKAVTLHSNLLTVRDDGIVEVLASATQKTDPARLKALQLSPVTVTTALPHIYLYHYGNQALQHIVPFCMLARAVLSSDGASISEDVAFCYYENLQCILDKEFVFERFKAKDNFLFALRVLCNSSLLSSKDSVVTSVKHSAEKLEFLANLLSPFLVGYRVVCKHLLLGDTQLKDSPIEDTVKLCQLAAENLLTSGESQDHRILSRDLLNNCFHFLLCKGAIQKEKRNGKTHVVPVATVLHRILTDIESFLNPERNVAVIGPGVPYPVSKL